VCVCVVPVRDTCVETWTLRVLVCVCLQICLQDLRDRFADVAQAAAEAAYFSGQDAQGGVLAHLTAKLAAKLKVFRGMLKPTTDIVGYLGHVISKWLWNCRRTTSSNCVLLGTALVSCVSCVAAQGTSVRNSPKDWTNVNCPRINTLQGWSGGEESNSTRAFSPNHVL
jgi:hypothetical protein